MKFVLGLITIQFLGGIIAQVRPKVIKISYKFT